MISRKQILSGFLLVTYLLVVLNQNIQHSHDTVPIELPVSASTHEHTDFEEVHHDHHFHVGIFHFLGHLFENLNHTDDLADDHLVVSQKPSNKKAFDDDRSANSIISGQHLLVLDVDAESLPDPPYHLALLQRLKLPNTPLRAPPTSI